MLEQVIVQPFPFIQFFGIEALDAKKINVGKTFTARIIRKGGTRGGRGLKAALEGRQDKLLARRASRAKNRKANARTARHESKAVLVLKFLVNIAGNVGT